MCANHNHKSDLISDAMTDVNLAVEDANSKLVDVDGVTDTEESVDDRLVTTWQHLASFGNSLQYLSTVCNILT